MTEYPIQRKSIIPANLYTEITARCLYDSPTGDLLGITLDPARPENTVAQVAWPMARLVTYHFVGSEPQPANKSVELSRFSSVKIYKKEGLGFLSICMGEPSTPTHAQ